MGIALCLRHILDSDITALAVPSSYMAYAVQVYVVDLRPDTSDTNDE
ncbi:hypothetical protein [Xylella fastidiosa]|nr:hypothetical protein [Xylella fastidiosa]